jgi:membrane protease YdiL (CAAX protease family)
MAAGGSDRLGAGGTRSGVLVTYAAVGVVAAGLASALGHDPIACDGWLGARGAPALLLSLGLGVCLAAATIAATRAMVRRAGWVRELHAALRPTVHGATEGSMLAVAVASAAGEELLFRGLLVPLVGVVASSAVFGALHQIRGRARWGWMAWAALMGLLFALVFVATGSLLGPIVAHAAINHANLRFLRDTDLTPPRPVLGGLLRRS